MLMMEMMRHRNCTRNWVIERTRKIMGRRRGSVRDAE